MNLTKKVYGFSTKYKEGFTNDEVKQLLNEFKGINMKRFYNALNGITCIEKEGRLIIYHCDILSALKCGIENRDLKYYEWD